MGTLQAWLRASWLLPVILSTIAGAVDVIGFLGLGGLFAAHITGNLVIVAAHFVTGGFSQAGPLLAVPVFMAVLGLVTLASGALERAGPSPLRGLLALEAALLTGFLGLGVGFGPFPEADSPLAVLTGMLGVAAMATQNATGKLALKQAPSTAVMTTNITQLTVDLATIVRGRGEPRNSPTPGAGHARPSSASSASSSAVPPGPHWKSSSASGRWRCRLLSPLLPSHWGGLRSDPVAKNGHNLLKEAAWGDDNDNNDNTDYSSRGAQRSHLCLEALPFGAVKV